MAADHQPSTINHQTSPGDGVARAYLEVTKTPAGAAMIADLIQRFQGNPFDATSDRITSFRCGQLAAVEYILDQIEAGDRQEHGQKRQETATYG